MRKEKIESPREWDREGLKVGDLGCRVVVEDGEGAVSPKNRGSLPLVGGTAAS